MFPCSISISCILMLEGNGAPAPPTRLPLPQIAGGVAQAVEWALPGPGLLSTIVQRKLNATISENPPLSG